MVDYYVNRWATPCDGVIECLSNGEDETGCESPFYLLPFILLGSAILLYFVLVFYLHFRLKKRMAEILKLENLQPVTSTCTRTNKLIHISTLTEQEDIVKIHILFKNEVEVHGSFGKAICYLKVLPDLDFEDLLSPFCNDIKANFKIILTE